MSEWDAPLEVALFLDHIAAGVERLEAQPLDHQAREEAGRLAIRLFKLARVKEAP